MESRMVTSLESVPRADGSAPGQVLQLLREQALLYGQLESFSRKQRTLVAAEDHAPLLTLLVARQKVAAELARVSERFENVRRDWSAERRRLTSSQQAEADALIGDIKHGLQRVIEGDEQDARVLAARKAAVVAGLHGTQSTSAALRAYVAAAPDHHEIRVDEAS